MGSKFAIFALIVAGFVSQGCSTPITGADMSDYQSMRQEAWSAYNNCLDSLAPYGRQAECDNVQTQDQGNTYNNYYYGNQQPSGYSQPPRGYYQPAQVQTPQQYYGYSTPPPYYMFSATPDQVNEMTGKWLSLAEQPEKAL